MGEQDELAEPVDRSGRPWLPRFLDELTAIRDAIDDVGARIDTIGAGDDGHVARLTGDLDAVRAGVDRVASLVTERLTDHDEVLQASTRQQIAAVEENRANIEKALLELRRSLVDSDDLVRSLLSRLDDVGAEVDRIPQATATATTDALEAAIVSLRRELVSAIETTAPAHDLELDAEPIVGPIADVHDEVVALRAEVIAALRARSTGSDLSAAVDLGSARDAVVAAVESIRGEVQTLRSTVGSQQVTADDVRGLVSELTWIREEIGRLAQVTSTRDQPTELAAIRDELAQLKRRIALRATPSTVGEDQIAAIAERIAAQPRPELSDDEIRRIADVVAERLADAFEVVDEP